MWSRNDGTMAFHGTMTLPPMMRGSHFDCVMLELEIELVRRNGWIVYKGEKVENLCDNRYLEGTIMLKSGNIGSL